MQDTSAKKFSTTQDLQNWPVDFNILGSLASSGDGKWTASGRYINDDGVSIDLAGNVNAYTLYASYDGISSIQVLIGMEQSATNKVVLDDGCISVNRNDFLSSLSFHNAVNYKLNGDFDVTINIKPNGEVKKYVASFDKTNDRLLF